MLGRYEILGQLAEGGMANVYLGRLQGPEGFERIVALKMLKGPSASDPTYLDMLVDEARIHARLSHPGIVQVFELGKHEDTLFLAMELLYGQSLADVWEACHARGVRLRGDVVAWIGARVGEALHYAHEARALDGSEQNLVHRDVNPANVVITYDGHVKLIDFGLVKGKGRRSETEFGVVKGKLAYLSPEQVQGSPIDRRSDVFQLGATLWEISTDRRLFKRETDVETVAAIRDAIVPDPTTIFPEYPSLLWLVLRRALEREPEQRYATAAQLARDLDGVARAQGSILQTGTIAEIMSALFAGEREREAAWFKQAMAAQPPEDLATLRPDGPRPRGEDDDAILLDLPYVVALPAPPRPPRPPEPTTLTLPEPKRRSIRGVILAAAAAIAFIAAAAAIVKAFF